MKVLFDTNVVLDVLLSRHPWVAESAAVWQANDEGRQVQMILGNDFEDNLQIACAVITRLDAIVTRDVPGFKPASIPVLTPQALLAQLK